MAWSDPKTWSGDELLTASDLNQYVSENLSALYALVQGGGRKNLLHNGAMQVAQRGTSTALITSGGWYTHDRWYFGPSGLGTWTQSVENDAPTGSGFRKSAKVLITANSTASPDAADNVYFSQGIEGANVQSVKKGTANAEQLTLSFWVKSNKTGTYVARLLDNDNTRHVAATYTIDSSATWEEKTVTFPADTTGALDNDNDGSIYVLFYLASGSNQTSGTLATTWAADAAANRAVGQTNLAAATNNYWQITGVQLEVGSAATGFEHKDISQELAECQRYFQKSYGQNINPGTDTSLNPVTLVTTDTGVLNRWFTWTRFPVTMRTTPSTVNIYSQDGTANAISLYNNSASRLTVSSYAGCQDSVPFQYVQTSTTGSAGNIYVCHYTASADL